MKPISSKSYPHLVRLVSAEEAVAEEETKVIKVFRHKGQDYSIIEKDPGLLKRKKYIFRIDGETFQNNGKGWPSPEDAMLAIKKYVRDHDKEAVAAGGDVKYPEIDKVLGEGEWDRDTIGPGPDSEGSTNKLAETKGPYAFEVHVAHDASIYSVVKLHADSPEHAEELAFEMARNGQLNWALSEGNPTDDPYLPNDESVEQIDE